MDMWRIAFREGLAPLLSVTDLELIQKALLEDDGTLCQGITTHPEAFRENLRKPVEACCLVSYTGWKSGLQTVEEVEEYFARVCSEIDARLGHSSECRWLLNWFDETPREEMRRLLSEEIHVEIQRRKLGGKE